MLVGVASTPPSFPPSGILHHKKAKLPKHLQQSVYYEGQGKTNFAVFSGAPQDSLTPELKSLILTIY